jgi:hypothetical protein
VHILYIKLAAFQLEQEISIAKPTMNGTDTCFFPFILVAYKDNLNVLPLILSSDEIKNMCIMMFHVSLVLALFVCYLLTIAFVVLSRKAMLIDCLILLTYMCCSDIVQCEVHS